MWIIGFFQTNETIVGLYSQLFFPMTQIMPHPPTLRIPQTLAALPGIDKFPWPGPLKYLPRRLQLLVAQRVSNRLFQTQLQEGDLDFLQDTALRVVIKDLGFDWAVTKTGDSLRFSPGNGHEATTFSGNSKEFVLLASRREDPDTLFFQRRLSIEGNTELGLQVKNLIDSVDADELPAVFNRVLDLGADYIEALPQ